MRAFLDKLYALSGLIAAVFLAAICAVVVAQVALNAIDRVTSLLTGSAIGLVIPSYSTFAGLFLAAATFFALPYAFRHGAHIRVSLVLQNLPPAARHGCDILSAAIVTAFSGYFTWYMGALAMESQQYGDVTSGIIPVPLALPQGAMTLGLGVLTIACLDDLIALLRGRDAAFNAGGQQLLARREDDGAGDGDGDGESTDRGRGA